MQSKVQKYHTAYLLPNVTSISSLTRSLATTIVRLRPYAISFSPSFVTCESILVSMDLGSDTMEVEVEAQPCIKLS